MLSIQNTTWPVVWHRAVRSHQQVARDNALRAAKVLAERRREREDVERYLERHPSSRRRA